MTGLAYFKNTLTRTVVTSCLPQARTDIFKLKEKHIPPPVLGILDVFQSTPLFQRLRNATEHCPNSSGTIWCRRALGALPFTLRIGGSATSSKSRTHESSREISQLQWRVQCQ
jgi:hypothetical protein